MSKALLPKLAFQDFIKKQYGKNILFPADQLVDRPRRVLKTVLSLDIALSGGIPEGTVVLFSGKAKAGKTTISLHIAKNAIDEGRPVFYVNIEKRLTASLLKTINGLDPSKLQIVSSEEGVNLSAEQWCDIMERIIKDNKDAVVIVDSVAMLCTLAEQSESIGDNKDMAGVPKLLASFMRKNIPVVDNNNVTLIFISQYQTNRDPGSRKKHVEKGGMAIQYACSTWINVDWVQLWERDKTINAPLGHNVHLKIISSALGSPFLPCEVPLRFGKGVDVFMDLVIQCENLGVIEKSGAWYNFSDEKISGDKFQGIDNICKFLKENPDQFRSVENIVRNMVLPDVNKVNERKTKENKPEKVSEKA